MHKSLILFLLLVFVSKVEQTLGQPGSLDLSFGNSGKVISGTGNNYCQGFSVAIQSDGKIVIAGNASDNLGLQRFNIDGSIDLTFGNNGKANTDFGGINDGAQSLALQTDNKIVIAGYRHNGTYFDFVLKRYNSNGSIDSSFGISGKVITDFGNTNSKCSAITIQLDGKILAVGSTGIGSNYDFAIVRYDNNGNLDSTFGIAGKITTDFAGYYDRINSVTIQNDSKIVVSGLCSSASNSDFALARFNNDGSLDSTFGIGGKVMTDVESINQNDESWSVTIDGDGKILLAGESSNGFHSHFALACYGSNGVLDNAFGSGGIVNTDFGSNPNDYSRGFSVALQQDEKIIVGGTSYIFGMGNDFALACYDTMGNLDSVFGIGGKVTTDFRFTADYGQSLAIQSDGKIVLAGFSFAVGPNSDFALARYNGNPDRIQYFRDQSTLSINPNPFSTTLKVRGTKRGEIILYEITGKEILKQITYESETRVILENIPNGFYLLQYSDGKLIENFKLVKSNQ